jgi:hypothetical protein
MFKLMVDPRTISKQSRNYKKFYIGLANWSTRKEVFGEMPLLTGESIHELEWNYACNELVRGINRVRKSGLRSIKKEKDRQKNLLDYQRNQRILLDK